MSDFSKRFLIVILAVTVVVFGVMAASSVRRGKASWAGNAIGVVVTPVQKAFRAVGDWLYGGYRYFRDAASCQTENEDLRQRILDLEQNARYSEDYRSENERLRALLDMKDRHTQIGWIGARIVAKDSGGWYYTFTIDKGEKDGVKVNSVVAAPQGFVGYVYELGSSWAKVRTILDAQASVSAVCPRTNDRGVAEGNLQIASSGQLNVNYIPKTANIVVGDDIETSAMGGAFPEGIFIGKVVSVEEKYQGLSLSAVVQSAVNFSALSEVLVEKGA